MIRAILLIIAVGMMIALAAYAALVVGDLIGMGKLAAFAVVMAGSMVGGWIITWYD